MLKRGGVVLAGLVCAGAGVGKEEGVRARSRPQMVEAILRLRWRWRVTIWGVFEVMVVKLAGGVDDVGEMSDAVRLRPERKGYESVFIMLGEEIVMSLLARLMRVCGLYTSIELLPRNQVGRCEYNRSRAEEV